jgi:opacity protein-like surface antigen
MKHRYIAGFVALSLCFAAAARAQYYYYTLPEGAGPIFRLGLGPSFFQNGRLTQYGTFPQSTVDFDTGLAAEAAIGYAFNQYAALDFETGYIGAEINNVPGYISDNSRIYNVPFLVNFTLSCPIPRTMLVPYIGVGAGGADVVFDTDQFGPTPGNFVSGSENDVVFAGQAFAGLRFQFSRHVSFDLGYKFFATANPTFSYPNIPPPGNFDVGFRGARTHSVLFAFKFDF